MQDLKKLFLLKQTTNDEWDTYDSAIVCADTAEVARFIHPAKYASGDWWNNPEDCDTWVLPGAVAVTFVGYASPAIPAGVVLSSFRAG